MEWISFTFSHVKCPVLINIAGSRVRLMVTTKTWVNRLRDVHCNLKLGVGKYTLSNVPVRIVTSEVYDMTWTN